jgi:hypothetical protein
MHDILDYTNSTEQQTAVWDAFLTKNRFS